MRVPALMLLAVLGLPQAAAAQCPEREPCRGCGCAGGPGYRGPDGRCVSFRNLARVCGDPPDGRCVFENAPGTGANRDCTALPRGTPRAKAGAGASPGPAGPLASPGGKKE